MVRKKDLKVNRCCVCKFPVKLQRVTPEHGLNDERWYEIRCHGFGHTIVAHHKSKVNVVDIWNTINSKESE